MELNDAPFWEYHSGKISENSNHNFGRRKPLKRSNFKGLGWRSRWDSTGSSYELHPVALQVAEERSDERTVRGQEQPVGANPSQVS